jgi:hypothetical protein
MNARLLPIVIASAVASLAQADTTVAEVNMDAADSRFIHADGPFAMERKAPVMELRARNLRLPRVNFRDASLEEVARHLRQPGPYSDEPVGAQSVINCVILDQAKRNLRIDLQLEDVSLHDFLASLARKYGLLVAYDDHAITVTDPKRGEKGRAQ